MPANTTEIRRRLAGFDFTGLLVEELGWNRYRATPLDILVDAGRYTLKPAAEKCGLVVYECSPGPDHDIPAYPLRRKIERQVAKLTHEHLIVFVDIARKNQIWQWVRRQSGQPIRYRELTWRSGQTNESLVQTLPGIAFELEEEERLTIVDVASRVQQQVNDRVTKQFYNRFRDEHAAFLKFIEGIKETADREWYASLMLNRLMFIYFIQKKGVLDNDRDYLRNRMRKMQAGFGKGHFHRFYRIFLLRLFHEGLGQPEADRSPELAALLGKVPYLNGGLFDVHELEHDNPEIQIPDAAFEKIFEFFDAYHWHLDERPLRADNEINPDVLGYIFEKYINNKQMGAYYTKEDITGYISRNTVVPFLLEAARKQCPIAFAADSGVWRLLRNDPDRYIYEALRKGVDLDLPPDIAAGLSDLTKRNGWNRAAAEEFALPTETWREHIERRRRSLELRRRLLAGEVTSIDDLVTLNLAIERFALDVLAQSEGPELIRAFWSGLQHISVLDPTCGSGAFLFAALNILESLYSACLDSMKGFIDDLERTERKHHPNALKPFRDVLDQIAHHPNQRYFILKSIVVGNLYGVDIMEEAVEICKLRLFLKLVAQLDSPAHIEPLPDIDFNIRAGNTLVGFTSLDQVRLTQSEKLGFAQDELKRIDEEAEVAARAFQQFRDQQTQQHLDAKSFTHAKQELRQRLTLLRGQLDEYLAAEHGISTANAKSLHGWRVSHQPFHWFVEFYGIITSGGFDVVVGNPPYVEYHDCDFDYRVKDFITLDCGDLYAFVMERTYGLLQRGGYLGLIVPISLYSTDGFRSLQVLTAQRLSEMWLSFYANRPSQLFDGAQKRLTVILGRRGDQKRAAYHTSAYLRWFKAERIEDGQHFLTQSRLQYSNRESVFRLFPASLEKVGSASDDSILGKLLAKPDRLEMAITKSSSHLLYYTRKFSYFLAFFDFVPEVTEIRSARRVSPSELKSLAFRTPTSLLSAVAVLSSSTFFWFWNLLSDCRNMNRRDLLAFPFNPETLPRATEAALTGLAGKYLKTVQETSRLMTKSGLYIQTFDLASCKPIFDEIDSVLGHHFGLSPIEVDSIINYDIKYRMGQDDADEADNE